MAKKKKAVDKRITIPPSAVKLLNDLRKAGAIQIELSWCDKTAGTVSHTWICEAMWNEWGYDTSFGDTCLKAIQSVAAKRKKEK